MCNPFEDNRFFLWQLFRIFSFPLVFCKTTVVSLSWIYGICFFSLSFTRLPSILESSHLQSLQILTFVSCFLYSPFQSPIKYVLWVSLVAQWLRICLPMQGTQVRALVWEDPTCLARSSWAREPQLLSLRVWRGPRTAMKSGPRLPQLEKALAQKRRPNTAINK